MKTLLLINNIYIYIYIYIKKISLIKRHIYFSSGSIKTTMSFRFISRHPCYSHQPSFRQIGAFPILSPLSLPVSSSQNGGRPLYGHSNAACFSSSQVSLRLLIALVPRNQKWQRIKFYCVCLLSQLQDEALFWIEASICKYVSLSAFSFFVPGHIIWSSNQLQVLLELASLI